MPSLNTVIIMGNATRDPELKHIPSGTAVADMSLAINERYKNAQGEKLEKVHFVEVKLWGRSAEIAAEYVRKGDPVMIEGSINQDSWADKTTGEKRSKLFVRASRLHLMGQRKGAPAANEDDDEAPI